MYGVYITGGDSGDFDVSSLAHDITYTTTLEPQPGKLTLTVEKDPNGILTVAPGNWIMFFEDKNFVFRGRIVSVSTDNNDSYEITAYDQLWYMKNHDYLYLDGEENKSLQDIFVKICTQMEFNYKVKVPCTEPLDPHFFADQSYYDMISYCLKETNTKITGKQYFIRDRAGLIELNELMTNLEATAASQIVIGDSSLLTGYKYSVDIENDTANEIYLMESIKTSEKNSDKEQTNKVLRHAEQDAQAKVKWGTLRKIINIKEQASEAEVKEYAKLALEIYSKQRKSMRLEALGYPIYAGDGFRLELDKLKMSAQMYITSATHTYGDVHTMSLDVCSGDFLPDMGGGQ